MMDDQSTHNWALPETGHDGKQVSASAPPAAQDPAVAGPPDPGQPRAGEPDPGPVGREDAPETGAEPGPDTESAPPGKPKGRSFWRELPVLIVVALVIALLIKSFVVQAFYIPSPSMENTLNIGDKVLVNKLVYDFRPLHAGDIVVFNGAGSWEPVPPPAQGSSNPLVRLFDVTIDPLYHS